MKIDRGELILVYIDFHQTVGGKIRPAVVLVDTGDDDVVAAPVTSHPPRVAYDLAIRDWQQAGLNVPSYIRIHKLTVLPKTAIARRIGRLAETDQRSLSDLLYQVFCS